MKYHTIEMLTSAVSPAQYPAPNLPEIALAGRSNVGKSSFINAMVGRQGVARTSSQPGKTQTLNFYEIDHQFRFVDLPGYGYARVSKQERERFNQFISDYLHQRENLVALLLLMDFRHPPTDLDLGMKEFADELEIPYAIVATKVDKIKRSQYSKHIHSFVKMLDLPSDEALFLFSSEDRTGAADLWDVIHSLVE